MQSQQKRILAISSGGGHWVQLLRLRPAFAGERVTYVTVSASYRDDVGTADFYVVNDATRWNKFGLIRMALRLTWILLRVRPHVIVSTGAAPGYFAIVLGRFLRAKTVWIDSMANVDRLSLSGERAGRYADLWLTQWEHLSSPTGPCFEGAVA
jgi:UDP-N-acetylglucosamine:LPS N-acetylglucosamine transferase